jgi:hypothetical protein
MNNMIQKGVETSTVRILIFCNIVEYLYWIFLDTEQVIVLK